MDATLAALEIELGRMRRTMRELTRGAADAAHPDLDAAGYAFLIAVRDLTADGDPARVGDIAELMNLHKSSASRGVSTLESLGLVERLPDPDDARARLVQLTEDGRAAIANAVDHWRTALVARTQEWSTKDLEQFAHLLGRFGSA